MYTANGGGSEQQSGGSQSGNSGGSETGSETGGDSQQSVTVTAPEISGTTPFEESTSVTIQGPQGASVYYTIDGSTPTAESTLYEEAFSLTDSATVKAIAVIGETSSEVSSKSFTKSDGEGGDGGEGLDKD